ncbi:MAG: efflux RND transporter permease subunit, partial [Candidatus Dormibacterales bacterium]
MSRLTRLGIKYATLVFLVILLLFGAGVWAASQIRQDLLPDISLPFYAVITPDRGASPGTIDREITLPVSDAMQGLAGVNTVQSTSTSGVSIVAVEFNDGTDPNVAQQEMSAQLNSVRATLPEQAQASTIQAFSTSQLPILEYAISSQESLGALSTRVQAVALPKLKGVSGVSNVELTGAPTQQVEVTLNPRKLALHQISASAVSAALQQASMVQSAGTLEQDGHTVPVEISGGITSVEQIANTMVAAGAQAPATGVGGRPFPAPAAAAVPIRDLGTVALASAPADTLTRTNGRPSIGLQVIKSPDTNTVVVADAVKAALPGIETQIGHGVSFQDVSDQATPITAAISGILREGLLGALFAVVVIFAFLRNVRATLVAAIAIPLSLLVALIVLWWQGITLNILTLGAMMVAVGRVVDDAIVVLENITRHVSEGEAPLAAAYTGGREIITAVTASTLTTVAVFLPIAFLTGIAGDFFRPFALTVVTALLASLVVAVTVVPMLASRFLPTPRKTVPDSARTLLQRGYIPVIRWATGHRGPVIGAAALFFIASMALVPHLRVNLLDQSSSPSFPVAITMPANSTLAQTDTQARTIEALVRSQAGVGGYQATVGGSVDPFAPPGTVPADPTRAQVLVLVKQNSYDRALAAVTSALGAYSGPAKVSVGSGQGGETASASQMQLTVTAPGSGALDQATRQVEQALSGVPGLSQITSDLVASKPEYRLVPRPALARSGLGPQQLAAIVAQAADGQVAALAALPSG